MTVEIQTIHKERNSINIVSIPKKETNTGTELHNEHIEDNNKKIQKIQPMLFIEVQQKPFS